MNTSPVSSTKTYILDYVYKPDSSKLKKVIKYYKEHVPTIAQKIISITAQVFVALASLTIIGALLWIPTFKIKDLSYRIDLEKAEAAFKAKPLKAPADLPTSEIIFKTDKKTFNHITEYVIGSDQNIWYRRRGTEETKPGEWKPMFFDGALNNSKPVRITADGANLVVIDDQHKVHYRKVLSEDRGITNLNHDPIALKEAAGRKHRLKRHLEKYNKEHPDKPLSVSSEPLETYFAVDKNEKLNWKSCWYSFPVLGRIVNIFTGKRLTAKDDFAISHRGRLNESYQDPIGINQHTNTGVTTAYQFDDDNTSLRKYDPWAPTWAKVNIYFPETDTTQFVGLTKEVSASTILTLGYDYNRVTGQKTLKVLTNLCDIDTRGDDPIFSYKYETERGDDLLSIKRDYQKQIRYLDDEFENEGWTEHPLPTGDNIEYFNQVTIQQYGMGNKEKELRLAAKVDGKQGYFTKTVDPAAPWKFIQVDNCIEPDTKLLKNVETYDPKELKPKQIENYIDAEHKEDPSIKVKHFGSHNYGSEIEYEFEGKKYNLSLHKRFGVLRFVAGLKNERYNLIIPKKIADANPRLVKAFGNRRVIPVKMKQFNQKGQKMLKIVPNGKHPTMPRLVIDQ